MYSWPSAAKFAGYEADRATIETSASRLSQMLSELISKTSVDHVYLIGHSMGTHILADALIRSSALDPNIHGKIKELILAAPDIDAQYFREEIGPKLASIAQHVTMYCSKNDKALEASRQIHLDYQSAGYCDGYPTVVDGIDTIDASEADTSLIGHSYISDSKNITSDIYYLIKNNIPPRDREHLSISGRTKPIYWIFRKP